MDSRVTIAEAEEATKLSLALLRRMGAAWVIREGRAHRMELPSLRKFQVYGLSGIELTPLKSWYPPNPSSQAPSGWLQSPAAGFTEVLTSTGFTVAFVRCSVFSSVLM